MATISFKAGENFLINDLAGSGLGFFGAGGAGFSVPVGEFNKVTFITSSDGSSYAQQTDNSEWASASGVKLNGGGEIDLQAVPNYLSTFVTIFEHSSAVKIQNAKVYAGTRANPETAVTTADIYAYECLHTDESQILNGSGLEEWTMMSGNLSYLNLADSPGASGESPQGPDTEDTEHWWFILLSLSPNQVGSTECAAKISLEYL